MKTDIWIKVKYISDDGRVFTSKKVCEAHEKDIKQGLPPEYQAFIDMIKASAKQNNSNSYRLDRIKTTKDIKDWAQWNESNIFWNYVEPTKANYEIVKKIHKFQQPPSFPYYNQQYANKAKYDYRKVYELFYSTFLSAAWQKKHPDAAKNKIDQTDAELVKKNIKVTFA